MGRHGRRLVLIALVCGGLVGPERIVNRLTAEVVDSPRFVLPPGFVIEPVAGPPLVRYPLFGCFDNDGRLYVAEGTGQSVPGPELVDQKLGRITRLTDADGDGKFDERVVFADNLVFPQGVLWHDGVVYVASHPSIWRLEDTDGDGRADRRHELVGKFNFNGNGCDIHGPFAGPDGRLYWTDGRHGYRIPRADGTTLEGLASRIWRCRMDGSELERLCGGGFDNPVEIAWTAEGEMFGTMDQGAGDCLLHYIEGGVYPEDHPSVREFVRTGPMLGVVKRYPVELPAALCGMMRYRADGFGPEFRDTLLTTHYMTHKVVRSRLVPEGATFRAEDEDFLVSSDPHLRLTDVLEDADGSVLVIDMGAWFTYGFLGKVLPRPDKLGAIYRIRRADAVPVPDPRGERVEWHAADVAELVRMLGDPRPAVRDRAADQLVRLGAAAVRLLEVAAMDHKAAREARQHAAWALCRIEHQAARAAIRRLCRATWSIPSAVGARHVDGGRDLRTDVLPIVFHAAGLYRDTEAVEVLAEALQSDHPPVRRKAAESLGRIGSPTSVPALFAAVARAHDPFLWHATVYALIEIGDRDGVAARLGDANPRVRQAALVALDQMPDGGLTREQVAPLLDSADELLQQAALRVVSHRANWSATALPTLRQWLRRSSLAADQEQLLSELLAAAPADSDLLQLGGSALANSSTAPAIRRLLIQIVQQTRGAELPETWREGLRRTLTGGDASLQWEAIAAIRSRGWRHFDDDLRQLSEAEKGPIETRVAALECLAARGHALNPDAFVLLRDQLSESSPPLVRMAAARVLSASTLMDSQLTDLARRLPDASAPVWRLLLSTLAKAEQSSARDAVVEAALSAPAAEALTAGELDQLVGNYPAPMRLRLEPLRQRIVSRQQDQAAYLTQLAERLGQLRGDVDAGKEVFLAPKNNCFACHRAVGRGGTVGPELTKIGAFRTREELLQSIIFPSLPMAPPYQTHTVVTRGGQILTGLVVRDTPDAVHLRTTDLAERRIGRGDIQQLAPASTSMMPDGLERTLTPQQLADLLEFLCQQR
ncbi:MAG: PVC-type heme-binding CxxCH protein [Pirellulaceae bacterium]